jgi:hypothetical protein
LHRINSRFVIKNKSIPASLIYLTIFVVAFIPRTLALDAYVAPDEGKWIYRSAHFLQALLTGDLAEATSVAATPEVEVLAPAVPTMWTGAAGLAAKYWLEGDSAGSLGEYLASIPADTDKIPLPVYPWTRFPTVLLTSLSVVLFYVLLARLIAPPAALLAAILLALDPFFISMSRVIHHDALVTIFIMPSLLLLLIYRQPPHSKVWLLLSGLSGGLALSTKPTALYLVVFAGIFLLWAGGLPRRRQDWQRVIVDGVSWGVMALIAFVVIWPALWVAPFETVTALLERSTNALGDNNNYSLIPAPGSPLPELGFLFYPVNWLFKATLPLMAGLVALAIGWRRGWLSQAEAAQPGTLETDSQPATAPPSTRSTIFWLAIFTLLFLILLIPADTRDIRYFLPAIPALYALAAVGILAWRATPHSHSAPSDQPESPFPAPHSSLSALRSSLPALRFPLLTLLLIQLALAIVYFPYYVDYWNPVVGGPWLAPRLVKIGSGEGLDQMGRYLNQKPNAANLTVAVSYWESFAPFFAGNYTKAHYDDEADYILIYRRQIQNRNPFVEYWSYFSARPPEHKVSLVGLDYAWLYPGPQLRVVREADFGHDLALRGYRLEQPAAQPGQTARLTLVWAGATPALAGRMIEIELTDANGQMWAQASGPLLAPEGPSPVEGHYALEMPAAIERGDYELWVFLPPAEYEFGTGVKHKAGTIPVRRFDRPPVQWPADTNFGDRLTFGGADISRTTLSPGESVEIKFLWQARRSMAQSFTTFAHVVDEAGQIWGQADRIPQVGETPVPTNEWDKGEWLIDTFRLSLKPDMPSGSYTLLAGVYDSQTLERLPIIAGTEGQTVVEVTSLRIP